MLVQGALAAWMLAGLVGTALIWRRAPHGVALLISLLGPAALVAVMLCLRRPVSGPVTAFSEQLALPLLGQTPVERVPGSRSV